MLQVRMRSSPSFLVVNRRGLGVHLTLERFGSVNLDPSLPKRRRHQEVDRGQDDQLEASRGRGRNRRITLPALVGAIQVLVIFGTQLYDVVDGWFR